MPGRYSTRRPFRRSIRPVIVSNKNVRTNALGVTGTVQTDDIAKAVDSPALNVQNDVERGCIIKAIWIAIDFCGLGGTGVLNDINAFLWKNPGANLTAPAPYSVGTSNEKKFVIKQWHAMVIRNQDGNPPYHWEGWIKIPKRYHRMGADDIWQIAFICTTSLTGHLSYQAIYKWYT